MKREEYYKYKHLIDLTNHQINDNSKYSFRLNNEEVIFDRWDYKSIVKPSKDVLDELKDNAKFRKHRTDYMVLHRLDFTLSIKFMKKEYKKKW